MELIANRMELRSGHFTPRSLLPPQIDTLETLEGDENGITSTFLKLLRNWINRLAIAQRSADAGGLSDAHSLVADSTVTVHAPMGSSSW